MRIHRYLSAPVLVLLCCSAPACGPSTQAERAPPPAGEPAGHDTADTGPPSDSGTAPLPCDPPDQQLDSLVGEPDAEAGRSLAFVGGASSALALGVPEGAGGAGVVLLTAPDSLADPVAVSAAGVVTFGRALAGAPGGGLAVAALADDATARVYWSADPFSALDDLSTGPSYAASGDGAGVALAVARPEGAAVLLVGLPRATLSGSVWVAPVPDAPEQPLVGAELRGEQAADYAGSVVRTVGDLDGDGVEDLAVGAFGFRGTGPLSGRLYLLQGPWSDGALADADGVLSGTESYDLFGWSVDGGSDLDGDGVSDVVVGAPGTNGAALSTGAAHVFAGPPAGAMGPEDAWSSVVGAEPDTRLGWSVAALSGARGRVAVGGPGYRTNGGAVWVTEPEAGQIVVGVPVLESDGGAGAGGTLAAGDPAALGCDLLAVGAPDGSRVWVLGGS